VTAAMLRLGWSRTGHHLYWTAADRVGELTPWFNVLIHALGNAGALILLLVPPLERAG
jgi:hypothetical protein